MVCASELSETLRHLGLDDDGGKVEDSLVIGIDFGTTYSGVSWATGIDFEREQINFITSWPDNSHESGKVPTELWYDDDGKPAWGYEVPDDSNPFRWFKLLLLRPEDRNSELRTSEFLIRTERLMEESGRTTVELIIDYLRLLWAHTLSTIERARGETVVESLAIHVVVTVPALWKGYARQAMRDAIKAAGILDPRIAGDTRLTLVPEPEAAALSTLREQGGGIRPGDVYVICDAGGGTVDLISYEVEDVTSTKCIVLKEVVEGTANVCGGVFIDQAFESLCRGRLGHSWKRLSKRGIKEIMTGDWEHGIKTRFNPTNPKREYLVRLPAEIFGRRNFSSLDDNNREPKIKSGRIHFLGNHIQRVFQAVFDEIGKLVDGQIEKAAKNGTHVTAIVLVGGLGCSSYLYDYLNAKYVDAGITVLQSSGMKPRTAICRGAVIRGFLEGRTNQSEMSAVYPPITIRSTVSRASYGHLCDIPFNSMIHDIQDKFWDNRHGDWRAKDQMEWYLKRGEKASNIQPVRSPWCLIYSKDEFNGTCELGLYGSEDEVPPIRYTSSVEKLGKLSCRLDVEYGDLPDFKCFDGVIRKRLDIEIELVPSGSSVEFSLYIHGRKQGSQSTALRFI